MADAVAVSVVSDAALKSYLVDLLGQIDPAHYGQLLALTRVIRRRKPKPSTGPLLAQPATQPAA